MKSKEEYIDSLSAELKEWSADIDALSLKAENATEEVKQKYHAEIAELQLKKQAAHAKIAELKESSGDAWDSVKETADHIWHDLRTGVADVASKFH